MISQEEAAHEAEQEARQYEVAASIAAKLQAAHDMAEALRFMRNGLRGVSIAGDEALRAWDAAQ